MGVRMMSVSKMAIFANDTTYTYNLRGELLERLKSLGYSIDVVSEIWNHAEDIRNIGCVIYEVSVGRRGMNPINDVKLLRGYISYIKNNNPSIVLTYNIKPTIYGAIAARFCRVPCIANITGLGNSIMNGGILRLLTTSMYRFALKKAVCVLFQNESNQKFFTEEKVYKGRSVIIPGSGVNLSKYDLIDYPADNVEIRFLFIGRVMKAKGIDELIEAMRYVKARFPNVQLDIVGGCDEDYEEVLYIAEAENLLKYYGQQNDVKPFIAQSHCTVLPSYHEGMSNVLLESAASGRPVISTDAPGCKETYDDGVSGYMCKVKNAHSLAQAMVKFVELPFEEKVTMGKNGRKKMEKEFSRNLVIQAYEREIKRFL